MRKITEMAINAFDTNRNFREANTTVFIDGDTTALCLHGNLIAKKVLNKLYVTTAGWNTPTTKERLNGLSGVNVRTKKGQLYLNDQKWDGSLKQVN